MFRPAFVFPFLLYALSLQAFTATACAQMVEGVASEHIRMRLPSERVAFGRDAIAELERCYLFMNRSTGGSLPRRILIVADLEKNVSSTNLRDALITLGMNTPAAAAQPRKYLLHSGAREIARLGLLELSGGSQREDTEFLFEGMVEILAHDYEMTSRGLEASWVICQYLDQMNQLGLAPQRSWSEFSSGRQSLRSASPGITFLFTFRDLQGRDKPVKMFQALRRGNLIQSLSSAFRFPPTELESTWLQRVREYKPPEEITLSADDAPQLNSPAKADSAKPGDVLQLRLSFRDRMDNLLPDGVFVKDQRTGKVQQARQATEKNAPYMIASIPIESDCRAGTYHYEVTAIDEAGNLRRWTRNYIVSAD